MSALHDPGGRTGLPSFGEKLKQERVKRSITLEQISISTKIGTRMLQALEEDKFTLLPGGIFNKGFVRAYARCLGLDEDQTVADYLEASGEGAPVPLPEIKAEAIRPQPRPPSASKPLPWGLFAALLLLIALALSLWSRRQHAPESRTAPSPAMQKSTDSAPAAQNQPAPAATRPESASVEAAAPKPEAAAGPVSRPASATEKPAAPLPSSSGAQPGEFTVVVLAREDSWLSITADGKPTFTETLLAGDQHAIHARNQIVLKSGNTGAVDFVFNGKKLPRQGGYGEVKILTFAADGLQPAATPPPAVQ